MRPSEAGKATGAELPALTACEEMIAAVWSDVLDVKAVAPHESFFELGGHSLFATRVVSQLRSRFGVEIPLRAVFDNPTLGEMGRFIAALPSGWEQWIRVARGHSSRGGFTLRMIIQTRL